MAKLLDNTFRAVNIGLVNELAVIANGMGINIWKVIEAASHLFEEPGTLEQVAEAARAWFVQHFNVRRGQDDEPAGEG